MGTKRHRASYSGVNTMLEWNVIVYDVNQCKMKVFNVFHHGGFRDDVAKHIKKCKTKEEFAEAVRKSLFYYYGSKCEWEIIISPLFDRKDTAAEKVDVYWQVRNNWERFVDYIWNNKNRFCDGYQGIN